MKKIGRILCIAAVFFMLTAGSAVSQVNAIDDITKAVDQFSAAMLNSLPFNSTIGLNWSDPHIGKLIPSIPPHFGIGLTIGATSVPIASINELASLFDMNLPADVSLGFPLPAYTVEARIGGFFLPFDLGFKFGYLPTIDIIKNLSGFGLNYLLIGGDFRYSLVDLKLLKLSVGVGFNHLAGGITYGIGSPLSLNFGPYKIDASQPELGLKWETNVLDFKAQIAFPIIIFTPYAGIGVSYSWSKAGYGLTSSISASDETGPINVNDIADELGSYGITGITKNGFEQMREAEGFSFRLFGGISINLPAIRFDLTALYNLNDTIHTKTFNLSSMGVTFGVRLQI